MHTLEDAVPPGKEVGGENQTAILGKVREMCGWNQKTFPGSQPVSLSRSNLADLIRNRFVACEKTDGVRYLLLAASKNVFLIDRKQTVLCVEMHLPVIDSEDPHQRTLLDGELVTDTVGGQKRVRFLVYDAISINKIPCLRYDLITRLKLAYEEVIKPRIVWESLNPEALEAEKSSNNFLEIYIKDFFEIWDIPCIQNFSDRLPHLSDGIIFTPVDAPYCAGTCKKLIKWKPPHMNTVDFVGEVMYDFTTNQPRGVALYFGDKGVTTPANMFLVPTGDIYNQLINSGRTALDNQQKMARTADASPARHRRPLNIRHILECSFDPTTIHTPPVRAQKNGRYVFDFDNPTVVEGGWIAQRIRTDKTTPNDKRVVDRVREAIDDGVTFTELLIQFNTAKESKFMVSSKLALPAYYEIHGSRAIPRKEPPPPEPPTTPPSDALMDVKCETPPLVKCDEG
eukprot:GHVO01039907.1.p2 GENE.GHVO01039907.1~~GHVO01039907.1.p2  ORF type:complete len:455 (+),score=98.03 GHVO01039907.1:53-1417(+)